MKRTPFHTALLAAVVAVVAPTAFAEGLPVSLQTGLALWLDAGVHVFEGSFNNEPGVIHWCDVREAFAESVAWTVPPVRFQTSHVSTVPKRRRPASASARAPGTFSRIQRSFVPEK